MKLLKYTLLPLIFLSVLYPTKAFSKITQSNEKIDVIISFNNKPGAREHSLVKGAGGKIKRSFHIVPAVAATIPIQAQEALLKNPAINQITIDSQVYAVDIELENSWGVNHINSEPVHTSGYTGQSVKIGIIDSGINYNHPDLNDNYIGGYDFVENDSDPMDVYGHGTHVAGTACGEYNSNGITDPKLGIVGVSPSCALYSLRVLNDAGAGPWSSIIAALEWAVDNNLQIINLSLGYSQDPGPIVEQAFNNAEASGIYIVAAAGNSGNPGGKGNTVIYPAKYSSVVAVSAVDVNNTRPKWSSTGEQVELAAPGVSVYSTWNDESSYADPQPVCALDFNNQYGCYKYGSGTSMAAPHVAGVAALLLSKGISDSNNNGRINDEIRSVLNNSAVDIGLTGLDTYYGYGLVDAYQAVNYAPSGNLVPVANAGEDRVVVDSDNNGSEQVILDASLSYDPDGTIVDYTWYENGSYLAGGVNPMVGFALGEHIVTLTVTDNQGATNSDTIIINVLQEQQEISLSALGYKVKGLQKADLTWQGLASTSIDIYRDDILITTILNNGFFTDNINLRGGGQYIYKVCEYSSSTCSNESVVSF